MSTGAQSPSRTSPDPSVPKNVPQMTQADQRPGVSGTNPGSAPGEQSSGGVSSSAVNSAQESANSLGEAGHSRKDVETGKGPSS
ncbi:hypothetical protein IAR50_003554 [Cryptococcus sp. DSM 104548]